MIQGVKAWCGPVVAQVVGGVVALVGLWLLAGLAVTLVAGGVALVAVAALREAGVI